MVFGYARDKELTPWPRPWRSRAKRQQCDNKPANIPAARTLHRRPHLETLLAEVRLSTWAVSFLLALMHRCGRRLEADFGMGAVAKRFFARSSTTTQKHGGLACVDAR